MPKSAKRAGAASARPGVAPNSKLTRKAIADLVTVLEKGAYIETAAAFTGVHKDTFYEWMKRGRRDIADGKRSLYRELVDAVEKAHADFEVAALTRLGGEDQWQATAWRLERRFPERYGRRSRVDYGNAEGKPFEMKIDLEKLSGEERDALKAILEKSRGDSAADRRPPES